VAEPGAGNQSGLWGQRPAIDADVPETVTTEDNAIMNIYYCHGFASRFEHMKASLPLIQDFFDRSSLVYGLGEN